MTRHGVLGGVVSRLGAGDAIAGVGGSGSQSGWAGWNGSLDGSFTVNASISDFDDMCKFDTDRSMVLYLDQMTGVLNVRVVTTTGTVPDYHAPEPLDSSAMFQGTVCALDTTRVLICYITASGIYAVVASIDGSNVINLGTPRQINSAAGGASPRVLKLATDQCILSYGNADTIPTFNATCITTSGTTVDAPHGILQIENFVPPIYNVGVLSATSVFLAYLNESGLGVSGIVLSIASNTVSKFNSHSIVSNLISLGSCLSCLTYDSTHAFVVYEDADADGVCYAFIVTITDGSGNMSVSSSAKFFDGHVSTNNIGSSNPICLIDSTTLIVFFSPFVPVLTAQATVFSVSGGNITPYNSVVIANVTGTSFTGILLDVNRILLGGNLGSNGGVQVLSIV